MKNLINRRKEVIATVVLLGAAVVCASGTARAQLAVSDALTEVNTGKTVQELTAANLWLKSIGNYSYVTAASLSVAQAGNFYTSAQPNLISWDNTIFSQISEQTFAYEFPGWVARQEGENASASEQTEITASLITYKNGIAIAHAQANEMATEDFSGLATQNQTKGLTQLTATQINNQLLLQVIKQLQYVRQLQITDIESRNTEAGQTLNDYARPQADFIAHGW